MRPENPRNRALSQKRISKVHAIVPVAFVLAIILLSLGDLAEIIPALTWFEDSPRFPSFHEIHDILAIGLVIFAAYQRRPRLATLALAVYAAVHIPYFIVKFSEEMPELLRFLVGVFGGAFGIWLISRLYRSEEYAEAAQEMLRQSEKKYRDLYYNAPVAYFSVGGNGSIRESNIAAQSLLGYSQEELHDKNRLELYAPESVASARAIFENLKKGIPVESEEMTYLKKDGTKIKGLVTMNPVIDQNGQVVSMRGVVKDITEMRRAEEKIIHLNEMLRAIRNVNQLITHGDDQQSLIQKICDQLVLRHGFKRAWILVPGENMQISAFASSGFDAQTGAFLEQLKTGDYPECVKELLSGERKFVKYSSPGKQHRCALADQHSNQGVFRCKLENAGKLYGLFGISLPLETASNEEELQLLFELCDDVAFALAKLAGVEKQRVTEKRYQTILQTATDGFWLVNDEGRFIEVNDAYCRLTGYSREELLNMSIPDVEASETLEETSARVVKIKNIGVDIFETKHRRRDGTFVSLEVTAKYMSIEKLFFVFLHDITGRKQAEEALRSSEERLKTTVNNAPIGIATSGVDGYFLNANDAFCRILGYTEAELRKMSFKNITHPEDMTESIANMFDLDSGKIAMFSQEKRYIKKDGKVVIGKVMVTAVLNKDGRPYLHIAELEDVTERKTKEDEIKRSNEFFKAVFNSTKDSILVVNVNDFTIARANNAFLKQIGLQEERVIGRTCYEITHHRSDPCSPPTDICPLLDTVMIGQQSVAEHVHYKNGSEKVYVEVSTSPLKDENGKVTQVVHVSRDLTERKKAQEQLLAQDRLASIGQLVSGVAHEINNPMTSVVGFSELLLQKNLPNDVKADLKIINDEANRTAEIVRNLLTFARKHPGEKSPVDINLPVQRVLDLRSYEQKVNNINVITRLASGMPKVIANASQLQQVFFNIVVNAEFFMLKAHKKGTLTITTERVGDFVRASFKDDGEGISKENMSQIFTPFFTTREVGKGTGLGLSICHGIITEHSGRIYAESELGKGATFIVELPSQETTD